MRNYITCCGGFTYDPLDPTNLTGGLYEDVDVAKEAILPISKGADIFIPAFFECKKLQILQLISRIGRPNELLTAMQEIPMGSSAYFYDKSPRPRGFSSYTEKKRGFPSQEGEFNLSV